VTGSGQVPWGRSQVVFDVMDTVVRDPFTEVVPRFFGMSLDELMQAKNSSAWFEFERGNIDEAELRSTYFCDGRDFDLAGLKAALLDGYEFVDGMPELLADLRAVGHQLHAFSNYPEWYTLIEEKLGIESSHGMRWTSVSCDTGLRKPEPFAYQHLLRSVGIGRKIGAAPLLFVDNDAHNCEAAKEVGITSVHFTSAGELRERLGDYLGSRKRGTVPEGGWPPRRHGSADAISE
jgi:FMN phosphatase YigB (HAD superfamily)